MCLTQFKFHSRSFKHISRIGEEEYITIMIEIIANTSPHIENATGTLLKSDMKL
jgi:hypothetical protein